MKRLTFPFIFLMLVAGVFTIDTALAKARPKVRNEPGSLPAARRGSPEEAGIAQTGDGHRQGEIQLTERISIPFGIAPILPLYGSGQNVLVSGHGGCTPGQTVSIVISVTHTTGASAVGQTDEACSGDLQQWSLVAGVATGAALQAGQAEACGVAVTRSDGAVTDTFDWCRDVVLSWPTYLPLILVQP